ncbi:MAG TPA: acyltransferase family protein [Bacillota bacterium]|nr:acyltransferase family protein [Bacillota bacterium]
METQKILNTARSSEMRIHMAPEKRLLFIDNIRWLMIVFVVLIHLNCTYGNTGMWYYQEPGTSDLFSKTLFGMFGSFTQAYFMGLLFFIAGFFVPGSCDKKGVGRFIWSRLIRLGIPTLVFMAFLHPATIIIMYAFNYHTLPPNLLLGYKSYLTSINFLSGSGPLWFALALLIFSIIYGLFRFIFPRSKSTVKDEKPTLITNSRVFMIIVLISLVAFSIRLFRPIGTAFFNMQLCYFGQYIILFCLGIFAYRRNLLTNLSSELGRFWFRLALSLGIPLWGVIMVLGGSLKNWTPFCGGFHWQAAAYAIWESFFCVGVCLGLLVIFRERYNNQGRLSRFLSENAFGVYVFHTPLLVVATMFVRGIVMYPLIKMILMAMIVLPVCFGFSWLIRKIPPMRKIFS